MDVEEDSECSFTLSLSLEASIDSPGTKKLAPSSDPRTEESTERMDFEFSSQDDSQDSTGLKKLCTSSEASDSDHATGLMKLGTGQESASDDDETKMMECGACAKGMSNNMYL